ncbi:MAG: hypothetical protein Q8M16_04765 [Pirellulaceae bacterium]|nr:hypothetical protein [Pirellulaceae bacterium]
MKTESGKKAEAGCNDGRVVEVSGNRLTSTCGKGDDHQYTVGKDAKITCNGKVGTLSDIKEGSTIRMTMCQDDKNKITAIDCGRHIPELAIV